MSCNACRGSGYVPMLPAKLRASFSTSSSERERLRNEGEARTRVRWQSEEDMDAIASLQAVLNVGTALLLTSGAEEDTMCRYS